MNELVPCRFNKETGVYYSIQHPSRAMQIGFGTFILYEKVGNEGHNRGICLDQDEAFKWLDGLPLSEITSFQTESTMPDPHDVIRQSIELLDSL